ncbi:MAG: hypothetical protein QOG92_1529, partial [Verrucomicrobiota bacterium]|nr:hypothetical protein [Verrucomicrobiota bacterium]
MDDGKRKNSTVRRSSVSFLICWLLLTGSGPGAPLTAAPSFPEKSAIEKEPAVVA